jgi:hypothetical protein
MVGWNSCRHMFNSEHTPLVETLPESRAKVHVSLLLDKWSLLLDMYACFSRRCCPCAYYCLPSPLMPSIGDSVDNITRAARSVSSQVI